MHLTPPQGRTPMKTIPNVRYIPCASTETTEDLYPESDGKPIADSDFHYYWIMWMRDVLNRHFAQNPEIYISGSLLMYDIEGPMRTPISPDILVCFGIGRGFRRTYKVWEEGKPPDFVMEFPSERTYRNDLEEKMALYARMEIPEYFLYDLDRKYLPSPLLGFRLVEGTYLEIPPNVDGGIRSETLNLDFHLLEIGLDLYDPRREQWLRTATERTEQTELKIELLREEIARLKEHR